MQVFFFFQGFAAVVDGFCCLFVCFSGNILLNPAEIRELVENQMVSVVVKCQKHNVGFDGNLHQKIFLEMENSAQDYWFGFVLKMLLCIASLQMLFIEQDSMFILFIFFQQIHMDLN